MYVQVPRGSIVTASKAFAPQKSPNLCLKRRRSNPDKPTLDRIVCASKLFSGSYGDPVLEGRRPGGSVSAIMRQGSQAYLSLPPSCGGVSYSKQSSTAHITAQDSVRKNGMAREPTRVEEIVTSP
jgi:hypothetical protein